MHLFRSCVLVLAVLGGCAGSTAQPVAAPPSPPAAPQAAPPPSPAAPEPPTPDVIELPRPPDGPDEESSEPRAPHTQKKTAATLAIEADARERATAALTRLMRDRGEFSPRHVFRVAEALEVEGVWRLRFDHYYRGIRVDGSSLAATLDADGHLRIEGDELHRRVRLDTRPRLSKTEVFAVHRRRHPGDHQRGTSSALMLVRISMGGGDPPSRTRDHLVYTLHVTHVNERGCRAPYSLWIDAHTGQELRKGPTCIDCCQQTDPFDDP